MEVYCGQVKGAMLIEQGQGHDRKIRARKQRTVIGKNCIVNRTVKLLNQLPAEALLTIPSQSHMFMCEEK